MQNNVAVIILAAGLGTRMKSDLAKVLHPILDQPMLRYVLATASCIVADNIVVVVGHQADEVKRVCSQSPGIRFALQEKQMGTGHAVLSAMPQLADNVEDVIILCGDVPLLKEKTVRLLLDDHRKNKRIVSLLAVEIDQPRGYGRVIIDDQRNLSRIVEEADATAAEKEVKLINSGIYCVDRRFLDESLAQITPDNAQGEFYLTDIIGIGYQANKKIGVMVGDDDMEVSGVNSIDDLKFVEKFMLKNDININMI
jgi:UDP-N-acetylglucosamine diphosphorylase/glucosamine-1-phosphate N-acetyltransferase